MKYKLTEEQKKLVEDNHNLIYSFMNKEHLFIDEYYDICAIGLCKAAYYYNAEFSNFSTFAYKVMNNEVKQHFRKMFKEAAIPEDKIMYYNSLIDDSEKYSFLYFIPDKSASTEAECLSKIYLDEYIKKIPERDRKILLLCYLGYTQMEVSKIIGISQSQVSRIQKAFKTWLKK